MDVVYAYDFIYHSHRILSIEMKLSVHWNLADTRAYNATTYPKSTTP